MREPPSPTGGYGPYRAQQLSTSHLKRPKARRIDDPRLRRSVQEKLDSHWSPEQISGRLRREFPDNDAANACARPYTGSSASNRRARLGRGIEGRIRSGRSWSARPKIIEVEILFLSIFKSRELFLQP